MGVPPADAAGMVGGRTMADEMDRREVVIWRRWWFLVACFLIGFCGTQALKAAITENPDVALYYLFLTIINTVSAWGLRK